MNYKGIFKGITALAIGMSTLILLSAFDSPQTDKEAIAIEKLDVIFLSPSGRHDEVERSNLLLTEHFKQMFPLYTKTDIASHIVSIPINDDLTISDQVLILDDENVATRINKLVNDNGIKYFILFNPQKANTEEKEELSTSYHVILIDVGQQKLLWKLDWDVKFLDSKAGLAPDLDYIRGFMAKLKADVSLLEKD